MKNKCIKCDVISCTHNEDGCNCNLNSIQVANGDGDSITVCDSFDCR